WSTSDPCLEKSNAVSSRVTFHPSSLAASIAPAVGCEHPSACWPQEMMKIFLPFWAATGSPLGALFVPAYSVASAAFAAATASEDELADGPLPVEAEVAELEPLSEHAVSRRR